MNPCSKCGAEWYPSPNPSLAGKMEHFCKSTGGIMIQDPNFPEDLSLHKTKELISARKEEKKVETPKKPSKA